MLISDSKQTLRREKLDTPTNDDVKGTKTSPKCDKIILSVKI